MTTKNRVRRLFIGAALVLGAAAILTVLLLGLHLLGVGLSALKKW